MTPAITPNPDAILAGAALRILRQASGLTLRELADRVGAHRSTLSRFERGERECGEELRARIALAVADELAARSGRAA